MKRLMLMMTMAALISGCATTTQLSVEPSEETDTLFVGRLTLSMQSSAFKREYSVGRTYTRGLELLLENTSTRKQLTIRTGSGGYFHWAFKEGGQYRIHHVHVSEEGEVRVTYNLNWIVDIEDGIVNNLGYLKLEHNDGGYFDIDYGPPTELQLWFQERYPESQWNEAPIGSKTWKGVRPRRG